MPVVAAGIDFVFAVRDRCRVASVGDLLQVHLGTVFIVRAGLTGLL